MFRILSVDGGGARGIFPAHLLSLLSNSFNVKLFETFDLITGTSTGAIIAAAAAVGVDMSIVVDMYETKAARIFSKNWFSCGGLLASKYSSIPFRELLTEVFGDTPMSAARTRLMLPTTDVSNGNVFVIKSPYLDSFVRDRNIHLVDAVLASCAAPSYFDAVRVDEYLLADGGLWANNPSFVAYTEAVGKLGVSSEDVRILSIGTGTGHQFYDAAAKGPWGLATGWGRSQLVNNFLNLQSRASSNATSLLLPGQYLRLTFDETGPLPLDDVSKIPTLKAKAGETFTYKSGDIRRLLGL